MKLTIENYEFLMFELLEGNLNENDKKAILTQIEKDAFYSREWILMQHTIIMPDLSVGFDNADKLLKPVGKKISFYTFWPMAKIAASLLLIGTVSWWYFNFDDKTISINTPPKLVNPKLQILEQSKVENAKSPQQAITKGKNYKFIKKQKENKIEEYKLAIQKEAQKYDPEILEIKPKPKKGMDYKLAINETLLHENILINKPVTGSLDKRTGMFSQIEKLRISTKVFLADLPNLKLKVTPKIKNHRPTLDIELKGQTIYANALLEIK